MRTLMAALSGLVFGLGIVTSGMGDPAKVLNFFDVIGTWDPSLGLVMGSALGVTMLGYRLVLRRERPVFAEVFTLPTARDIDARLIGGSAVFGIGWGLSGFCPGGSIPMLGSFSAPVFVFTAAMLIGIFTARTMQNLATLRRSQPGKV